MSPFGRNLRRDWLIMSFSLFQSRIQRPTLDRRLIRFQWMNLTIPSKMPIPNVSDGEEQ